MWYEELLELIAPTRCSGCDRFSELLCERCLSAAHTYQPLYACKKCAAPFGELVCTECWDEEFVFSGAVALGPFELPLSRSVVLYKDKNEQRLARYLGALLALRVHLEYGTWVQGVTWVPPSKGALRVRGFDHGGKLAAEVARVLGVPARATTDHVKSFDLRKLNKQERREAVQGGFVRRSHPEVSSFLRDRQILLIDDVMTTGATLNEVASKLIEGGAREVRVAVIARTW